MLGSVSEADDAVQNAWIRVVGEVAPQLHRGEPLGHGVKATHPVSDTVGLQDHPLDAVSQRVDAVVRGRARDGVRSITAVGLEAEVKRARCAR
jgi:hypothetical protein